MLTDADIRTARPGPKVKVLKDEQGLYLELRPDGSRYWRLRYWVAGRERRISLGVYPAVSLKQARQNRDEARGLLAKGLDPGVVKAQAKKETKKAPTPEPVATSMTFEALAREWHDRQLKVWSDGHGARIMGRLENHLFEAIGSMDISGLRAPAIYPVLREIEKLGHHETAKRLRQYVESIYVYALARGLVDRNVGMDLRGALAPCHVKNRPALTDPKAVGQLLRAIRGYAGGPVVSNALRLAPLTFVRPGELRKAEWAEVDLDNPAGPQWVLPAEKTKMRREHIIPLSTQAVEIFEDMFPITGQGKYVFPCNRTNTRTNPRAMSDMTINSALRRLGYDTQDEMCAHGFRAMASTMLHEAGWPSDVVERQLAHVEGNSVKRVYNRAELLPERRRMMQEWSNYLDRLAAEDYAPLVYGG
jgi:integrase